VIDADPKKLMAADAWVWAEYSKLNLGSEMFSTKNHEFQIQLLQDDSPRQCYCKSTQAYGTQAYVIKALHGLIYNRLPKGVLYLFPTLDDVTDFSTTRFKPMIKDNPSQIGKFVRDTDRENLKKIQRGHLYFRGGRLSQTLQSDRKASSRLKSIPVDWVIFDEFDEMDQSARDLAIGRMADSNLKWETYLGNPTIPNYGIDKVFRGSDQRYWEIKCMSCGKWTNLKLEFLANPPGPIKREIIDGQEVVIRACMNCGKPLDPTNGEWIAQYPTNTDMVGRTISHMESVKTDLAHFLKRWEDPDTDITQFYNIDLGEAYTDAENRLTPNDVFRCCCPDQMEQRSEVARCAGVDVGKRFLHVVIGYPVKEKDMLKVTWVGRVANFNELHDVFQRFTVKSAVIDAEPETHKVREFQAAENAKIFLCDYQERLKAGRVDNEEKGTITIRRTEICDATHRIVASGTRFEIPRRCAEINLYAEHMSNLVKVLQEDPKTGASEYRYVKINTEDHYRHSTNYFYLACQDPAIEFEMMKSRAKGDLSVLIQKNRVNNDYDPLRY
jgi:hypothetical protein